MDSGSAESRRYVRMYVCMYVCTHVVPGGRFCAFVITSSSSHEASWAASIWPYRHSSCIKSLMALSKSAASSEAIRAAATSGSAATPAACGNCSQASPPAARVLLLSPCCLLLWIAVRVQANTGQESAQCKSTHICIVGVFLRLDRQRLRLRILPPHIHQCLVQAAPRAAHSEHLLQR